MNFALVPQPGKDKMIGFYILNLIPIKFLNTSNKANHFSELKTISSIFTSCLGYHAKLLYALNT